MQKIRLTIGSIRQTDEICHHLIKMGIAFSHDPLPNCQHWIEFDDESGRTEAIIKALKGHMYKLERI